MREQHKKGGTHQVQTGVSNTASAFKTGKRSGKAARDWGSSVPGLSDDAALG
ncbi:MAG: hypothetical protein WC856_24015 [Methylococcaceae bacterium]